MKNQKKNVQEQITTTLEKCRRQIKSSTTRQLAIQKLDALDSNIMSPENKIQFLYINARYHYLLHKAQGEIEALEWSNDYFDDLATYAYEFKKPLEIKMLYSRAYVKFLLGNLIWDEERKPWLHEKAKNITERIISKNPSNSSFNWLNSQLKA